MLISDRHPSISTSWWGRSSFAAESAACGAPDNTQYYMTHSIISLGQRAAPSALLLRASGRSKICESLPTSSSGFFNGPFWPADSVTDRIRLSSRQPDFQQTLQRYGKRCAHFDHLVFRNRSMNFRSRIREEIEFYLADALRLTKCSF